MPFALESSADNGSAAPSQGPLAGPSPGASAHPGNARSAPVYRPAQSGASTPETVSRRSVWFYVLLGGDGLLVGLAAVLVFGGWMQRPWAKATAIGALVMGGAMSALAVTLPRREGPAASRSGESRVRVHLTRV